MSLSKRWHNLLQDLQAQGRHRRLVPPHGFDFSSNDYLGYAKLTFPGEDQLSRSGAASRLLRGQHPLWNEVETTLARWHGAEAGLMMTSGYVANEGLLSTVIGPDDWVASDAANHASIIDGLRLGRAGRFVYRHRDLNHLEEGIRSAHQERPPGRELFIVTESLFGMEGDSAPLAELAALAERYQANLIVDEAHATGCCGPVGSGLVDQLRLRSRVLATVHTGGKALGVPGAYIAGSALLKELLVNRCRHLIFTTALPPIVAGWWLDMLPRVQTDEAARSRLHANAKRFRCALAECGIAAGGEAYIVPILLGDDAVAVAAANKLQELGYDIRAIRPPTVPPGTARLRISIHANHEPETITRLAAALKGK